MNLKIYIYFHIIFNVFIGQKFGAGNFQSNQPRIQVIDGHMTIFSGYNQDISLKTSGIGKIKLNEKDISEVAEKTETMYEKLKSISENEISDMKAQIDDLKSQITELAELKEKFSTLKSSLDLINNEGSKYSKRRIYSLRKKVRNLQNLLSQNECLSNPCQNGGTCVDMFNGFLCKCPGNWKGSTCSEDVNECLLFSGTDLGCQNGATCRNTMGSYRCDCSPNWHGIHCTQNHDDCSASSSQALCGHGTCINVARIQPGQPKYHCICEQGWTTEAGSPACNKDVNECNNGPPVCSTNPPVQCINIPGGFYCGACPAGYSGNGYSCADINECNQNNGGCSLNPRVECTNTIGSRKCGACPSGYVGNGVACSYIGICNMNNGGCHPLAVCSQNLAISATFRTCHCPSGYVGNGIGTNGCVQSTGQGTDQSTGIVSSNPCNVNPAPCGNGQCFPMGQTFQCVCNPGFTGLSCNTQFQPCSNNPCQNGGTCTVLGVDGYTCTCTSDYSGTNCETLQQSCGDSFSASSGSFRYPHSSAQYYPLESCAWTITTTKGKVLNLTFKSFDLEDSYGCAHDFLQLNDGSTAGDRVIGRYCGSSAPGVNGTLITTHNSIYFWFHSDSSVQGNGFEIFWNTTDPICGGELRMADYGNIKSPGYPGVYPHNHDCYWIVEVTYGRKIQFNFATLRIEKHSNCSYDFLKLYDGPNDHDPVLKYYCSTTTPPPITTSGSQALLYFHSDSHENDQGFHITYTSIPGLPGCGGVLTSQFGTISSPNFPEQYTNHLECDWLIRVHPDDKIELNFFNFSLEDHSNCAYDYVEIYDGEDENSPTFGRYCGDSIPRKILSNGNQLLVKFVSDVTIARFGFKAKYVTKCGKIYNSLSGVIKSPNYPHDYPGNKDCIYKINVPLGKIIKLSFQTFDIEYYSNCDQYDYLRIVDGNIETDPEIAKLCGDGLPEMIISSYNHLWMQFKTDAYLNHAGFLANYSTINVGCGGILTAETGVILSPSHPEYYGSDLNCVWFIRAKTGFVVRLTFTSFNLQQHSSCLNDYVQVNDSSGSVIGRYCGSTIPPILTSSNEEMLVTFKSNLQSYNGFSTTYVTLNGSSLCGANYYTDSGMIQSPNYPKFYPHSRDCVYVIKAKYGHQIMLNFTDFHLENHTSCDYDFLEIRNGESVFSPLIGKFCGVQVPRLIPSHTNVMRLRFRSDDSQTAPGFRLYYDSTSTGCGGTLNSYDGSIWSPNYPESYGHNSECSWLISVSQGSWLNLNFIDLDLESGSNCVYDSIEVYEGSDANGKLVGKYCDENKGISIEIKKNSAFIKFSTDGSNAGRGFNLQYESNCSHIITNSAGIIESPNFPNLYPHNRNCSWTIRPPKGHNVSIAFSHLSIEDHSNCIYDYVQILKQYTNGSTSEVAKYCGTNQLPYRMIQGDAVINFLSDASYASNGFRLEFKNIGCGHDMVRKSGYFSSPNYPNGYKNSMLCIWTITVPEGNLIVLDIHDYDIENHIDCNYDHLSIFRAKEDSEPILKLCNKMHSPKTITSPGNHLYIIFESDSVVAHKGFNAYYHTQPGVCGGKFSTDHGTMQSVNYPQPYPSNSDCSWFINVPKNHLVDFEFKSFDMGAETNCSDNYVALYNGKSIADPKILKHCGDILPNPASYKSTANNLYVRMLADGVHSAKGFKAVYKTGCGSRINVDLNDGELFFSPHNSILRCDWVLYTEKPNGHVILTFTNFYVHYEYQNASSCDYHYVEIKDGDSETSPLKTRICGDEIPPSIVSEGSSLHVSAHRIIETYPYNFRAIYSEASSSCGGRITSTKGKIASPGYPNQYLSMYECTWHLEATSGHLMQLSFKSFSLEDSSYCNKDFVEVREQNEIGLLIGRFCGKTIPSNLIVFNRIWLRFRSDSSVNDDGFVAEFSYVKMNALNSSGFIASPIYPANYLGSDSFSYLLTARRSYQYLVASLSYIAIENSFDITRSCKAYLEFFDGPNENSPSLKKICGYNREKRIIASGSQMFIKFQGDRQYASKWRIYFRSTYYRPHSDGPSITYNTNCGQSISIPSITANASVITSPGYPNGYANNLSCEYFITSPIGTRIRFNKVHMDFANSYRYGCYEDKLRGYDVSSYDESWYNAFTICNDYGYSYTSISNKMRLVFQTDATNNGTGFDVKVSAVCGGYLFEPNGILDYSLSNDVESSCIWKIRVHPGKTIKINFFRFNFPEDVGCTNSHLIMRNGISSDSPLLGTGKYCGSSVPIDLKSSSNQIHIKLVKKSGASIFFRMKYEEIALSCGGSLYLNVPNPNANISTPSYPNPMPHAADCVWVIMGPAHHRLHITFKDPFEVKSMRYDCFNHYVSVNDGGTTQSPYLIPRVCGRKPPKSVVSSQNIIMVKYHTVSHTTSAGFQATIEIAKCGGTYSSANGIVTSPGYPNNYENNLNCIWYFHLSYNQQLNITFDVLDLPSSDNCSNTDHLEFREGTSNGSVLAIICGKTKPSPILSFTSSVFVRFRTNGTGDHSGFKLKYTSSYSSCYNVLTQSSGIITSPNFPAPQTISRHCRWIIFVTKGRKIKLTFNNFNLPYSDSGCKYELLLFDGPSTGARSSKSICQNTLPDIYHSSDNMMEIYYYSASLQANQGFSLTYTSDEESVCGADLNDDSGSFESPSFGNGYNNSVFCMWNLPKMSAVNSTLVLEFFELKTRSLLNGTISYQCAQEKVSITKHVIATSYHYFNNLKTFCGNLSSPIKFISTGLDYSVIYRQFLSNFAYSGYGFKAKYKISYCGGMMKGSYNEITSPNFPDNYPDNIDCYWKISVEDGSQINITFSEFNLVSDCQKDYLIIRNGQFEDSPIIGTYCGQNRPPSFLSEGSKVVVQFHSDAANSAKGFKFISKEEAEGCGGIIHGSSGLITSKNYPKQYPVNIECEWDFVSSQDFYYKFTFVNRFDVEMHEDCSKDFVQISYLLDNKWIHSNKSCGLTRPSGFTALSHKAKVYFRSDSAITGNGFQLKYYQDCLSLFYENSGVIASPNFPKDYPLRVSCNYTIMANDDDYIYLVFDDRFYLEDTDYGNCYDYIQIYDKKFQDSNKKYCGKISPQTIITKGQTTIKFYSDSIIPGLGFRIDYHKRVCGGNLTNSTGVIMSPSYPNQYPESSSCTWFITVPPQYVVALRIKHLDLHSHDCNKSYVSVYDGHSTASPLIKKYCYYGLEKLIHSKSNKIMVDFHASQLAYGSGFFAVYQGTYSFTHGCGGVLNATQGTLKSLDIDNNGKYESNLDCIWKIAVPNGQMIKLSFNSFAIQSNPKSASPCTNDFLEIRDGYFSSSVLMDILCGNDNPGSRISSTNTLFIHFHSDEEINTAGFNMIFEAIDPICGGILQATTETKTITSPNYPSNYPINTKCRWKILNSGHNYMNLNITSIEIETSKSCSKDYLQIQFALPDELPTTWNIKNCGSKLSKFSVPSMDSYITFNSDADLTKKGFSLSYFSTSCNFTIESTHGFVYTDEHYVNETCFIKIKVPADRTITLNIAYAIHQYSTSYVKMRDGNSMNSPELFKTNGYTRGKGISSTGNYMLLEIVKLSYFLGTFTSTDKGPGCGGEVVPAGFISSPPMPYNHSSISTCDWLISDTFHTDRPIMLHFDRFDFSSNKGCDINYMEIYDGYPASDENKINRFCGQDRPANIRSSSSKLLVRMHISANNTGSGFMAHIYEDYADYGIDFSHIDINN